MKIDIKSLTLTELENSFMTLGQPKYRAQQVFHWLHKFGLESFSDMNNIPFALREKLEEEFQIKTCVIERFQSSKIDDTIKFLFALHDGALIESVLMSYKHGDSLCISSQVGCNRACAFCATAKTGYLRDLSASEMLSQIHAAQAHGNKRISNVVLMGMGEPLDNLDSVLRFIDLANSEQGLNVSKRNIAVSTCGVVPGILKLAKSAPQVTLSVSLHAPNDSIRKRIMPVNKLYSVSELLEACRKYVEVTGRRVTFEYALFKGLNDSSKLAFELAELLKDINCHVNLIPANPIGGGAFQRSDSKTVKEFAKILSYKGINATVRRTLGEDIDASCGQLKRRVLELD